MAYKWCVVHQCTNTSIKNPQKIFVTVPTNPNRRNMWLQLSQRDPNSISSHSSVFMCEDHFDLEKDMENYWMFKIMGSVKKIRLKPDCVPSRFECQAHRRIRFDNDLPVSVKSELSPGLSEPAIDIWNQLEANADPKIEQPECKHASAESEADAVDTSTSLLREVSDNTVQHGNQNYKTCTVPCCKNTTLNAPHKIFFPLPKGAYIRKKWANSMNKNKLPPTSAVYCCQDHFDIEKDTSNYLNYKLMCLEKQRKTVLRLRKSVFPHKFECQNGFISPSLTTNQATSKSKTSTTVRKTTKRSKTTTTQLTKKGQTTNGRTTTQQQRKKGPAKRKSTRTVRTTPSVSNATNKKTKAAGASAKRLEELTECNKMIANVYYYLQAEYVSLSSRCGGRCDLSPLADIKGRTAAATGTGRAAVSQALRAHARHALGREHSYCRAPDRSMFESPSSISNKRTKARGTRSSSTETAYSGFSDVSPITCRTEPMSWTKDIEKMNEVKSHKECSDASPIVCRTEPMSWTEDIEKMIEVKTFIRFSEASPIACRTEPMSCTEDIEEMIEVKSLIDVSETVVGPETARLPLYSSTELKAEPQDGECLRPIEQDTLHTESGEAVRSDSSETSQAQVKVEHIQDPEFTTNDYSVCDPRLHIKSEPPTD